MRTLNPGIAKIGAALAVALVAVACAKPSADSAPVIASVSPNLVCPYAPLQLTVAGENFALADSSDVANPGLELPTVALSGPSAAPAYELSWQNTQSLRVTTLLGAGMWQLGVTNPSGARSNARSIWAVPPPAIATVTGNSACTAAAQSRPFVLDGNDLLQVAGQLPSVSVGNVPVQVSANPNDCVAQGGDFGDVQVCRTLSLLLPPSVGAGNQPLSVSNPAGLAGCPSTAARLLAVPGVTPSLTLPSSISISMCSGGGPLTLSGSNLSPNANVLIGGVGAVYTTGTRCDSASNLCQQLTAVYGAINPSSGSPSLTVTNPGDCAASQSAPVTVKPGPQLLAIDPPVIASAVDTNITLYLRDLNDTLTNVSLVGSNGTTVSLCNSGSTCQAVSGGGDTAGDLTARLVVPASALQMLSSTPSGTADISVQTSGTCGAYLPQGLRWTASVNVDMTMAPAVSSLDSNTPVVVQIPGIPTSALDASARIYVQGASHTAALQGVSLVNGNTVQGLIPAGLRPQGAYEDMHVVVVLSSTPAAWRSNQTWRLSGRGPLTVSSVFTRELSPSVATPVQLAGTNFDVGMQAQWVGCTDAQGVPLQPAAPSLTISSASAATLTTVPLAAGVATPVVCTLQLVGGADGQSTLQPGMTFVNPLGTLSATHDAGVVLATPRQDLGAAIVRLTPNTAFLYAAGGHTAVSGGSVTNTVEYLALNPNGGMGSAFNPSRNAMQVARANFGLLAVQRALYAVGGISSTGGALSSIERAEVLDPNEAPAPVTTNSYGFTLGVDAANYAYSVAALYGSADPFNPCGESLPSTPVTFAVPLDGMHIDLTWTVPPGSTGRSISGYRIYRSTPNGDIGSLTYLTDVAGTTFKDAQNLTPNSLACATGPAPAASMPPLALGSTSVWVLLTQKLNTARLGAGFVALDAAGSGFLYALSGSDGRQMRSDYEVLQLNLAAGTHAASWESGQAFNAAALPLTACNGQPRAFAGAAILQESNSSRDGVSYSIPAGLDFLFLGPGQNASGTAVAALDSWLIGNAGVLQSNSAGAQCVDTNGQLSHYGSGVTNAGMAFLGGAEHPSNVGHVGWADINGVIGLDASTTPNGTQLLQPRRQGASAQDGPFIYLIGGANPGTTSTPAVLVSGVEYGAW